MIKNTSLGSKRATFQPLDDLEPLTDPEIRALAIWRQHFGTLVLTREPEPGRTQLRCWPEMVPLVETFDRATCSRLVFARRLREQGWES